MHSHSWSYILFVLLAGLSVLLGCVGRVVTTTTASPVDTVRVFYARHFVQGLAFTEDNITAKAPWLAPDLYAALIAALRKPPSPDEVPLINGDPFTDTQEYPTSFEIQHSEEVRDIATVTVHFALPVGVRVVRVLLTRLEHNWRITDLLYEGGLSLRRLLADGA